MPTSTGTATGALMPMARRASSAASATPVITSASPIARSGERSTPRSVGHLARKADRSLAAKVRIEATRGYGEPQFTPGPTDPPGLAPGSAREPHVKFGVTMFMTDQTIGPVDLAREVE